LSKSAIFDNSPNLRRKRTLLCDLVLYYIRLPVRTYGQAENQHPSAALNYFCDYQDFSIFIGKEPVIIVVLVPMKNILTSLKDILHKENRETK